MTSAAKMKTKRLAEVFYQAPVRMVLPATYTIIKSAGMLRQRT